MLFRHLKKHFGFLSSLLLFIVLSLLVSAGKLWPPKAIVTDSVVYFKMLWLLQ